jgi:hypothetical protein
MIRPCTSPTAAQAPRIGSVQPRPSPSSRRTNTRWDCRAGFRISAEETPLPAITRFALRELAQRALYLDDKLNGGKLRLGRITEQALPALTALRGVALDVVSTLLLAAGDTPERLLSERSFASLCGASPVQASSGKTHRQANATLWRITLVRPHSDPRTKDYLAKRVKDGKSKTDHPLPQAVHRPGRVRRTAATRHPLDSRSIGSLTVERGRQMGAEATGTGEDNLGVGR